MTTKAQARTQEFLVGEREGDVGTFVYRVLLQESNDRVQPPPLTQLPLSPPPHQRPLANDRQQQGSLSSSGQERRHTPTDTSAQLGRDPSEV